MALHNPHSTPLLGEKDIEHNNANGVNTILSKPTKKSIFLIISLLLAVTLIVSSFIYVSINGRKSPVLHENNDNTPLCASFKATTMVENKIGSRGVEEGVSAKSNGQFLLGTPSCVWTNRMLGWQRTSFHFQAPKNWINDPNGPVLYKGNYHLFYQYNPEGPVWGNIVWGHAISKDLINWRHLPLAMETDQWYDINGVWTGSATIFPDGQLVMLYTGSTNQSVQVQNLAYPADPSDPFLTKWVKYSGNPVLVPPPGIDDKDFRDPTTAWLTSEGKWRITIGSKINKTGLSLVYDTVDFKNFELKSQVLHAVPRTGMWECVDFYPVSKNHQNGLDTSYNGPDVKHVVKVSLDDTRYDTYAIGTYNDANGTWVPDDYTIDVGIGLRYDYGTFYASKTFYDQEKQRRILWGWIKETDSELADLLKGWASLMDIPRTVVLDEKTGTNLLQWPVEEVEQLRKEEKIFNNVSVRPGSIVSLDIISATQLDIEAEFEVDNDTLSRVEASDAPYSCSSSGGAQQRGVLGPFGLSILSTKDIIEQTPIYFYIMKSTDGNFNTHFCSDQSRSSLAKDVDKGIYGSTVPVLKGEKLTMRILVDHSIVESFAQKGRTCITSRVYPTKAIYEEAALFLFNNATNATVTASLKVWQMASAQLHF